MYLNPNCPEISWKLHMIHEKPHVDGYNLGLSPLTVTINHVDYVFSKATQP